MKNKTRLISAIFILSTFCVLQASAAPILLRVFKYENISVSSPNTGERYIHAQMAGKYAAM